MQKRPVEVVYFDGNSAIGRQHYMRPINLEIIQLSPDIEFSESHELIEIPYQVMEFIGAVGRRPAVVELPNDARIEFIQRVPHWFNKPQKQIYHWIWQFERSPLQLMALAVVALLTIFAVVKWLIPWIALQLAYVVPDNTVYRLGEATEKRLLARTKPSTLSLEYQQRIHQRFVQEIAEPNQPAARLIFRQGQSIGANALAIPNNSILLTDELIALAGNEEEVLAVLAHEQGHLLRHHAMQKVIAASSVAAAWEMIFQDGSSVLTAAAVKLSDSDYSKRLEYDADDYAMQHLHARGISSIHLSNFLQRVENMRLSQPQEDDDVIQIKLSNILNTHPEESARIQRIHDFDDKMRQSTN